MYVLVEFIKTTPSVTSTHRLRHHCEQRNQTQMRNVNKSSIFADCINHTTSIQLAEHNQYMQ